MIVCNVGYDSFSSVVIRLLEYRYWWVHSCSSCVPTLYTPYFHVWLVPAGQILFACFGLQSKAVLCCLSCVIGLLCGLTTLVVSFFPPSDPSWLFLRCIVEMCCNTISKIIPWRVWGDWEKRSNTCQLQKRLTLVLDTCPLDLLIFYLMWH